MKKSNLLAVVIGLAILPLAHATTVGFAVGPTSLVLHNSAGVNLATTSLIWAGNFTSEVFTLNPALTLQQNVTAITMAGGWEQFGVDTVTDVTNAGVTGAIIPTTLASNPRVGGTITDNSFTVPAVPPFTKADYFNGKGVYLWVFNASTVVASTEMGIFRAPAAATAWTFPNNGGGVGDSVNLSTAGTTVAAIGTLGAVGSTPAGFLQTAPVPEPSTALLTALGLLGMALRRRRNVK